MSTYNELRLRPEAKAVYWVEISGIRDAFSSTKHVTAASFTDAYTPTLGFWLALEKPGITESKTIEILKGGGTTGGMEIRLTDFYRPTGGGAGHHGYMTWLFGSRRPTIARTRLTADVDLWINLAGHDLDVVDTSDFPATAGRIYIGTETFDYPTTTGTQFENVVRSMYKSPAQPHRGNVFGSQTIYPDVTDHPTVWQGRIVTLFQTFMDGSGQLARNGAGTERSEAHKIRGILRDLSYASQTFTLRCDGIDTLLKRPICRSLAQARVPPRIHVLERRTEINGDIVSNPGFGDVLLVWQIDGVGTEEIFCVAIPTTLAGPTSYTDVEFIDAINEALADPALTGQFGGLFFGTLTLEINADAVTAYYISDAASPRECYLDIGQSFNGQGGSGKDPQSEYWSKLGLSSEDVFSQLILTQAGLPGPAEEFRKQWTRGPSLVVVEGDKRDIPIEIGTETGDSPIADFILPSANANFGGGFAVLVSEAGDEIVHVDSIDTATNIIWISRGNTNLGPHLGLPAHPTSPEQPLLIRRLHDRAGQGVTPMLQSVLGLLLSTGQNGYNDPDYDTFSAGVGIAVPSYTVNAGADDADGLIDVASFRRFFTEASAYYLGVQDYILEPIPAIDWLQRRLASLGGYLVVQDGQITVRKGVGVMQHEGRVFRHSDSVHLDDREMRRPFSSTIGGLVINWNWKAWLEKFLDHTTFIFGNTSSEERENLHELEDKGIQTDVSHLQALAIDILNDYGHENPEYTQSFDRSAYDLEPGQGVRMFDEGAGQETDDRRLYRGLPNMEGTRGHDDVPMLATAVEVEHEAGVVNVTMIRLGGKRGGYSPSAWINTFVSGGGVSTLTCLQQVFSPVADGVDVSRFAIGDVVKVIRVSPPTAAVEESAGHFVTSIQLPATIVITPVIAGAGLVSGEALALIHDDYQDAAQTDTAKAWCATGDGSGDIGDTGDPCYDW